jgi:hypothetical protein
MAHRDGAELQAAGGVLRDTAESRQAKEWRAVPPESQPDE